MTRLTAFIHRLLVKFGLMKPIRFDKRGRPISVMGKRSGVFTTKVDPDDPPGRDCDMVAVTDSEPDGTAIVKIIPIDGENPIERRDEDGR